MGETGKETRTYRVVLELVVLVRARSFDEAVEIAYRGDSMRVEPFLEGDRSVLGVEKMDD